MIIMANKQEQEVLNEIRQWKIWREVKVGYEKKDLDFVAKEIKKWQRKLKTNGIPIK